MKIAVMPGDDIGPEITEAALTVLRVADSKFQLGLQFEMHEVGMASHRRIGTTISDAVVARAKQADGVLPGPAGMSAYPPVPGEASRQKMRRIGNRYDAPVARCLGFVLIGSSVVVPKFAIRWVDHGSGLRNHKPH